MMRASEPGARVAREFGRAMQALHARTGGDAASAAAVGRFAALAWRAADAGHVCVDVDDAAEREMLTLSPVVGPSGEPRPLVLERGALYLHRLWRAETALARARLLVEDRLETAGGRVLGVTGLGATLEQALSRAYQRVGAIHFEGAHYRTDIGRTA